MFAVWTMLIEFDTGMVHLFITGVTCCPLSFGGLLDGGHGSLGSGGRV